MERRTVKLDLDEVAPLALKLPESGSRTYWTEFEPELDQGSVHCRSGSRRSSKDQVRGSEPSSTSEVNLRIFAGPCIHFRTEL